MKRKFVTQKEVFKMLDAVRYQTNGARDYCLIMLCFWHGFRISEALDLRFQDIAIDEGRINVSRIKNGFSTVHPFLEQEREALVTWISERDTWPCDDSANEHIFISRKGKILSRKQAYCIVRRSGELADVLVKVHPHMLRHACGYALAERGIDTRLIQDYLGHRNIRHTVRYTASNAARFAGVWNKKNLLDDNEF